MSASTTHQFLTRADLTTCTACVADRRGRKPYDDSLKLASKIGSSTSRHACCTTRSRTVGMPRGRDRPSGLGISTRSTGCGRYAFAFRSAASSARNVSTPERSIESIETPSTPGAPAFARTSLQARHKTSGRTRRSYKAWNRRFRLLLAARNSLRWRCRDDSIGSIGWSWLLRACTVTSLLAGHDGSRGPSLHRVCLDAASTVLRPPPTSHRASPRTSLPGLYRDSRGLWFPRPDEISLVALMAVRAFRSPYAGESFGAARPESSPLPWPSRLLETLGSHWIPLRG